METREIVISENGKDKFITATMSDIFDQYINNERAMGAYRQGSQYFELRKMDDKNWPLTFHYRKSLDENKTQYSLSHSKDFVVFNRETLIDNEWLPPAELSGEEAFKFHINLADPDNALNAFRIVCEECVKLNLPQIKLMFPGKFQQQIVDDSNSGIAGTDQGKKLITFYYKTNELKNMNISEQQLFKTLQSIEGRLSQLPGENVINENILPIYDAKFINLKHISCRSTDSQRNMYYIPKENDMLVDYYNVDDYDVLFIPSREFKALITNDTLTPGETRLISGNSRNTIIIFSDMDDAKIYLLNKAIGSCRFITDNKAEIKDLRLNAMNITISAGNPLCTKLKEEDKNSLIQQINIISQEVSRKNENLSMKQRRIKTKTELKDEGKIESRKIKGRKQVQPNPNKNRLFELQKSEKEKKSKSVRDKKNYNMRKNNK